MNQSFFIAAVGAHQQQKSLNVQSNNIANVNTQGFKAERSRFSSLMHKDLRAIEDEVSSGLGAALPTTVTDFSPGAAVHTGRDQDYLIDGDGFFVLVDLNTNEMTLTRNGSFTMASLERYSGLTDDAGNPIMETVYYLSDGEGRFVLGANGSMIEMENDDEAQDVGIFDYLNYNGMEHQDGTMFLAVDKNGGLRYGTGTLVQGYLEGSNADLADEMTKVIETQRAYSLALKMMTTSDEIETTINGLRG